MRPVCTLVLSFVLLTSFTSLQASACGDEFTAGGLDELRLDALTGENARRFPDAILAQAIDHYKAGRLSLAEDAFREARERAARLKLKDVEVSAMTNLANLMTRSGKLLQAERLYQASLKISKPRRHLWQLTVNTYYNLAILYKERGELDRAKRIYQRTLTVLDGREAPKIHTATLNNLGNIYREQGKFRKAERVLRHSLQVSEGYGDHKAAKQAAKNIARLYEEDYGMNGTTGLAYRRSITPTKRTSVRTFRRAF